MQSLDLIRNHHTTQQHKVSFFFVVVFVCIHNCRFCFAFQLPFLSFLLLLYYDRSRALTLSLSLAKSNYAFKLFLKPETRWFSLLLFLHHRFLRLVVIYDLCFPPI